MSLTVGKETDIRTDKRFVQHVRDHAMGDVYDALAELLTNADDSYGRLFKQKRIPHDGGHILIEHLEQRKGTPSLIVVRDGGEGKKEGDKEENLLHMGRRSSKAGDRGYMGRGAKDCSALGTVTFESIKDGRYFRARISQDLKFKLEQATKATAEHRASLGIKQNGTSVTIELRPGVKLPRIETLSAELPWHYALRDLMGETSPSKILLRRSGTNETQSLVYHRPEGEKVVDETFTIPAYSAKARLVVWRAGLPLEGDRPRFERAGILVKGTRAIHECSALVDDLRRDPAMRMFFGRLECPYLDKLLDDFQARLETGQPPSTENPHLVMDPNRRYGLERRHPFVRNLFQIPTERLRALVKQEREREKANTREVANKQTRERLNKLAKLATRYLQSQLDELEDITEDEELDADSFAKRGALIYPTYATVHVGKERSMTLYVRRPLANPGTDVVVRCDAPGALVVHGSPFKLREHKKREDRLVGTFKVMGIAPSESVLISASGAGFPEVEAIARVVEVTKEDRAFQSALEFERVEYRVRSGRRRTLRLFAETPRLISREVVIDIASLEPNKVGVIGRCKLTPFAGTNYAEGEITVEGRTLNTSVKLTAEVDGILATTTVRVVEQPDRGPSIGFELRDEDFGNFRAIWADREGKPNLLLISARHDSLNRYLGDPSLNFPGQDSPLFRALVAEIVSESVCRKSLAMEARERPFDFNWADMGKPELIVDDVFAQFQHRQKDFLALAHEVMLGSSEINNGAAGNQDAKVTAGSG